MMGKLSKTDAALIGMRRKNLSSHKYYGYPVMKNDPRGEYVSAAVAAKRITAAERERDSLRAEVERLREALENIAVDAEVPQQFYDRNGPTWTSKSGAEYEDMSAHIDKCNELAALARAALSRPTQEQPHD
jgi:hypothetical protein